MRQLILGILFLGIAQVYSQYSETISSGRPGQAIGAYTVGKNVFQVQAGVDYFQDGKFFVPNSFFRYAFSDRFEVNSGVSYTFADNFNELSSFSIGSRINLYKGGEDGSFPVGLQVSYQIPTENLKSSGTVMLVTATPLTDKLGFTFNLGTTIAKKQDLNAVYVVNLSYAISDKVGMFIEPYGVINNGLHINFDTGLSYLVNNDLQLDILGGYGLNTNQGLMLGAGFSWRIRTQE